MSIATQSFTTIVNAAFLQDVKEACVELWDTVHRLRHLTEEAHASAAAAKRLVEIVSELRDQLAFAFSLEEAYGFIDGCRGQSPVLAHRAQIAKQQHRELYLLITELCEQAQEAQYRGFVDRDFPKLLVAAADFDAQLQAHEQFESELIHHGWLSERASVNSH